jgi:HSP20 family molecular chaperone IbpA
MPLLRGNSELFGGIGGKLIEKILNSTIKMVEKEMEKSMKNENKGIPSNFELYINGKRIPPEKIKITNQKIGNNQKKNSEINEEEKLKRVSFSQENKNLFLKLEKKEPSTSIRRLSNKIIYELNVPGVESINDISIIQLENSIEIKAIGKKFGYEKILPVSFPISNYYISEGKLILELKEN